MWKGMIVSVLTACLAVSCTRSSPTEPVRGPARRLPDDPVAAVKSALPAGWSVLETEDDPTPHYRPPGTGTLLVLGPPDKMPQTDHKPMGVHLYIMASDYEDGGPDPTEGQETQSVPPRLIYAGKEAKVYLWPATSDPDWKSMKHDLLEALRLGQE